MKRIAILTATRAEYGLLAPVIKKLDMEPEIDVRVVVTGMHLCGEFGMTVNEIRQDGVHIDREIDIRIDSDTPAGISKTRHRLATPNAFMAGDTARQIVFSVLSLSATTRLVAKGSS